MDATRFDTMIRALAGESSRRALLHAAAAAALGPGAFRLSDNVSAKNKKRKKKLKRNQFGCVDVGGKCRGQDNVCCSGICEGKKPKNGKKDRSRCIAHDTGGCEAGMRETLCGGENVLCTTSTGQGAGVCNTTTGNAGYCMLDAECVACRKDVDCIPYCGPRAACVVCPGCGVGTACNGPDSCAVPA